MDYPDVLIGWKQIAVYLRCSVNSARRWTRDCGLPVRRDGAGRPVAYRPALVKWLNGEAVISPPPYAKLRRPAQNDASPQE